MFLVRFADGALGAVRRFCGVILMFLVRTVGTRFVCTVLARNCVKDIFIILNDVFF